MSFCRSGARSRVDTRLPFMMMAALTGLATSPIRPAAWAQQLPLAAPSASEQSYYEGSYSIVDLPAPELPADFPELRGVELAATQDELPALLDKVGNSVGEAYHRLTSVVAEEHITQERFAHNGRRKSSEPLRFNYLIQVLRTDLTDTVEEYRADGNLRPVDSYGVEQEFPFSKNFACQWIILLPENRSGARFRYLGTQLMEGRKTYVLAFAERPGNATVTGLFNTRGKTALLLYQGLTWIDADSLRVVRLRFDLLEPRLDVALERETTEIRLGEVRISEAGASLWLPIDVTVTAICDGQLFRNLHHYSNFRVFNVQSNIKY